MLRNNAAAAAKLTNERTNQVELEFEFEFEPTAASAAAVPPGKVAPLVDVVLGPLGRPPGTRAGALRPIQRLFVGRSQLVVSCKFRLPLVIVGVTCCSLLR